MVVWLCFLFFVGVCSFVDGVSAWSGVGEWLLFSFSCVAVFVGSIGVVVFRLVFGLGLIAELCCFFWFFWSLFCFCLHLVCLMELCIG